MPSNFIPLCVPEIRGNEWQYIKECLDSGWVSSVGTYVERFEQMVADYVGAKYAVATVNGTAALHIALLVAGVQPGDEVITSDLTFIAPINAIRYVGAYPVLMDAEPHYFQIDVQKVSDFIQQECRWQNGRLWNKRTHRPVTAILPVHILGHPVDIDPLIALAQEYNLPLIEDATESLGASYQGHNVGNLGEIACFSFNGNKLITTGGGGMIVTNNVTWANRAKYLTTQAKDDPVEFVHGEIGYNYRLTNIQAAMGCAQMELLDKYIEKKRGIADIYKAALQKVPGITPMVEASWAESSFWMYTILVGPLHYGIDSRMLQRKLKIDQIQTRPLWQPAHLSPAHRDVVNYHCNVAEHLYRNGLSLPCSVGLSSEEQEFVIKMVEHGCYDLEAV